MAEAADFQGMGHSPARRWLRRTASVLAGAPLLAGLLAGTAAPAAQAAPTATGSRTVHVSLDTLAPSAPVKGDTLTVSGTVTNTGKNTITDAQVDLRVGPRMYGRTAIDDAAERTGTSGDVAPLGGKYKVTIPKLAVGIPQDFALSVPVSKLGLGQDGVYQLGVSLTGRTSSAQYDQVLGIQRTFLPWQPDATEEKTQLTVLWPLISSTRLSAETGSDDQQTPVFENDDLAEELAPGGRLEQLVSLGNQLPVTWVIDPDLLATADAMTKNYQVRSGDTTVPGKNQAVATKWLDTLEKAVQGGKVAALPFADPDLASLAHRGKDVSGALSHLQPATDVAGKTVETILHVKPSVDFAWPVDGAIDPSIVDVATSAGAHKVITRSDSLQDNLPYTPTAARPIGGGTTAVVADTRLSTAFQGDMSEAGASTLAVQKFLAQSLAVTLQDPENQRSIVVAPQRMPSAAQAQSMARALRGLDPERWTEPSDLLAAAAATPDSDATTKVPGSSRYPKKLRNQELPTEVFLDIKKTQERLDNFKAILSAPDRVAAPFGNAIGRAMSTSWRGEPEKAQQYRGTVENYLMGLTTEVKLIPKSVLTLSGRSATIPVTVQNQLLQGVQNLVLRLKSDNPTRLKLDGDRAVAERPIKIDGGHSQSVKFTGAGNANGPVQVTAQLYTVDGTPYGSPMTFQVKVSEITPTVMLVIAGGVLLLVLAGVKMYSQRKRAVARKAAAEDTEDTDGGDDTEDGTGADGNARDTQSTDRARAAEGTDPGQPSDPTPDTGPESADASGAGEKVDR
ncbi:DUF6049 family protein [Streptomyces scopuliridis]|uniref:DUF6049 family protein n=1 Tax=Streptomyces scopuliridis TaxID=452529 RepID=A0ACD4ZLZ4_9ACTN|nr:DUF6049 family protein [Streptomyces scopuliridis]WSB99041.1 DUF6049 family protein [Streptomyces scopuliridis]WSC07257.1 DUF6049 family protein [Streptomyces scopuliridis]